MTGLDFAYQYYPTPFCANTNAPLLWHQERSLGARPECKRTSGTSGWVPSQNGVVFTYTLSARYVTVYIAQGGYSGFQVTGMIEGFFGFEIFDSGIFWGTKIWQVFFWVA